MHEAARGVKKKTEIMAGGPVVKATRARRTKDAEVVRRGLYRLYQARLHRISHFESPKSEYDDKSHAHTVHTSAPNHVSEPVPDVSENTFILEFISARGLTLTVKLTLQ